MNSRRKQNSACLSLVLKDEAWAVEKFVKAVSAFTGYVKAITKEQQGKGPAVHWFVKTKEGSGIVCYEPSKTVPKAVLDKIYNRMEEGLSLAQKSKAAKLPVSAVKHRAILLSLAANQSFQVCIKNKSIVVNKSSARKIISEDYSDYCDFGTIDGVLQSIKTADGKTQITIKDILYAKPIAGNVPEKMVEQALRNYGKRVEIKGEIHYQWDDTPKSIEVQNIYPMPDDSTLPGIDDVAGIMSLTERTA